MLLGPEPRAAHALADEIVRYIACVSPDLSCDVLRFFGTAVIGL
jgi:hypothetical protein